MNPLPSLNFDDITNAIEKRLFIGKVPPGTSDDEIAGVYGRFGNLTEIRQHPGRQEKDNGIAFVRFESWASAHRALLETDGQTRLGGHDGARGTLVVSFAERTQQVGKGGGAAYLKGLDINRVFVGGLPEDADDSELQSCFSSAGRVEGVQMLPAKQWTRCAFVTFTIWGEALDAVETLHGTWLRRGSGAKDGMSVTLAEPRQAARGLVRQHPEVVMPPHAKRQRVAEPALAPSTMDSQLQTLLQAYTAAVSGGSPKTACDLIHESIMKTRESHQARVQQEVPGAARKADGRMDVGRASATNNPSNHRDSRRSWQDDAPTDRNAARLFIGGLPHEYTDDDLHYLAKQLSFTVPPDQCDLVECRVLMGRGCGYLRYNTSEAAEEAFSELDGRLVDGWSQCLRVKWATPHKESKADVVSSSVTAEELQAQGMEPTRLFIGQMARDCDAGTLLRPMFDRFGHVTEWRYVQDKGILYVSYSSFEESSAAMEELNNTPIPGISKALNVKYSQQRRAHS